MQLNLTISSTSKSLTILSTRPAYFQFLDHWVWKFYAYLFASLFGIFALSCLFAFVQQCKQSARSRNIHGRFTTVQLFAAATLKVVRLLWRPVELQDMSEEVFTTTLLMECISVALNLSAFSILLLILLESTKTSLVNARLQNIWVLLAITGVLTALMLTLNLLAFYGSRFFWYFLSYIFVFIWGILICVGYAVAGYRMWQNLKSSREQGRNSGDGRLKRIIILVFLSPFITAAALILSLCLAASSYGIFVELEITEHTKWSRYPILCLLQSCDLAIMVVIFGIVIRSKFRRSTIDGAPTLHLGTFDKTNNEEELTM